MSAGSTSGLARKRLARIAQTFAKAVRIADAVSPSSAKLHLVPAAREASPADGAFTKREAEIVEMVRAGYRHKEIARALGIAERTVKFHLSSGVYRKMDSEEDDGRSKRYRLIAGRAVERPDDSPAPEGVLQSAAM